MKKEICLYELLKVDKAATPAVIRKAYFALARQVHPDKNKSSDATSAFQSLQKAYGILSDPQKREKYDQHGLAFFEDQNADSDSFWKAYEHFRGIQISEKDIEDFEQGYRETEDEKNDLINFFNENKGDVSLILAYIIGSRDEDIPRFVSFFEKQLGEKKSKLTKKFKKIFNESKTRILNTNELDNMEEDLNSDDKDEMSNEAEDMTELNDFIVEDDKDGGQYKGHEDDASIGKENINLSKGMRKNAKSKELKKLNNVTTRPQAHKGVIQNKSSLPGDLEYGDMETLRAAIQGKASKRKADFGEFEKKWKRSN